MFRKLLTVIVIGVGMSELTGCRNDNYQDLNDETLAKIINIAYQKVDLLPGTLAFADCKDFYTQNYPKQNPFITQEAFIAKAKQECPSHMQLLHNAITGALAKRLTVDDLKTKAFWQQYDKSQVILAKKATQR